MWTFLGQLHRRHVLLMTDSQVVYHLLRSFKSRVDPLYKRLQHLFYILDSARIVFQPRWIPTSDNVLPDTLSRLRDVEDWQLNPTFFCLLDSLFGPHHVDHFASALNRQCLRYNSRWADVGSEGDAFAAPDWASANNWVNPPWTLLPRVVALLSGLPSVHAIVLVPEWVGRPWFRKLHNLAWASIPIPRSPSTFLSGRSGHLPQGLPRWRIVALRLDRPSPPPTMVKALESRHWQRLARSAQLQMLQ